MQNHALNRNCPASDFSPAFPRDAIDASIITMAGPMGCIGNTRLAKSATGVHRWNEPNGTVSRSFTLVSA
jgi:hypothetical protein